MTEQEIKDILQQQNHFFSSGKTIPAEFRLKQLESLKEAMIRHEADLAAALKEDLGKSRMESYMCEIGLTLSELTWIRTSDTYILSKITYFCKCFTSGQTGKTILEKRRL
jgi:acyl-CoA reductase-like NAD-dependent aldehyde dehydrogenase